MEILINQIKIENDRAIKSLDQGLNNLWHAWKVPKDERSMKGAIIRDRKVSGG